MNLVTMLLIIIAILSVSLIVAIIYIIALRNKLYIASNELRRIDMSTEW